jgi:hypothetical protein
VILKKYADRFIRGADGRLEYINSALTNMGGVKTEGIDLALNYLSPMTSTGRFGFGIDGTYVIKYDRQEEKVVHGKVMLVNTMIQQSYVGNMLPILTGATKTGKWSSSKSSTVAIKIKTKLVMRNMIITA